MLQWARDLCQSIRELAAAGVRGESILPFGRRFPLSAPISSAAGAADAKGLPT